MSDSGSLGDIIVCNVVAGRFLLGALPIDRDGRPRLDFGVVYDAGLSMVEILAGVFAASTWDFVNCAASLKASGNLSIIWCSRMILFTSSFTRLVLGSCQNGFVVCHFSSPMVVLVSVWVEFKGGKVSSLKWQSASLALNMFVVMGSRYLSMKGESNPM